MNVRVVTVTYTGSHPDPAVRLFKRHLKYLFQLIQEIEQPFDFGGTSSEKMSAVKDLSSCGLHDSPKSEKNSAEKGLLARLLLLTTLCLKCFALYLLY